MTYTVIWKPSAHAELAEIWNSVSNRPVLADTANQMDRQLKMAPREQGESRAGSLRILFIEPLGVIYDVNDDDRIVSVVHIWTT